MREKKEMLYTLYQWLWLSADFESDLTAAFPDEVHKLRYNEYSIPLEKLNEMISFLDNHPIMR